MIVLCLWSWRRDPFHEDFEDETTTINWDDHEVMPTVVWDDYGDEDKVFMANLLAEDEIVKIIDD